MTDLIIDVSGMTHGQMVDQAHRLVTLTQGPHESETWALLKAYAAEFERVIRERELAEAGPVFYGKTR